MNKFDYKKGREEEALSQARALICPEGSFRIGMLFGVRLTQASDFGVRVG